jgi:hypothetical protein
MCVYILLFFQVHEFTVSELPPSLLYNGYRGVHSLEVKRGRGVTLIPSSAEVVNE